MANDRTLTAANALITLSINGLFTSPQRLQGFATDNIYEVGTQELAETAMGVDGRLSAGFVFAPIDQTFTIQADSLSIDLFEQWAAAQKRDGTVYRCNGNVTLIAVDKTYVMGNGALVSGPPLPSAGKILQPRKYMVRWESVLPSPN